jgi:hypothetical protein
MVETIMVEWWRSCRSARDGDQCAKIGYTMSHIVYACDVYPLRILFCFDRDGSIIRWSLTINFKIKCVLPSYTPLQKIVVLKHHVIIGCYKLYVHIQRVTRVNSTNILDEGLRIGERAMTRDSGIEIGTRRTQVHVPAVEDCYILLAI